MRPIPAYIRGVVELFEEGDVVLHNNNGCQKQTQKPISWCKRDI